MILSLENVKKEFRQGDVTIQVLKGINLQVQPGETVSIVGPSGGGKSTLLSILSGVAKPTSGQVIVDGNDFSRLSDDAITQFRGKTYGIVFQQFHLISHLTAIENVILPLEILQHPGDWVALARASLREVGLEHREHHRPAQLSGGEIQRVALARALVTQPKLLLADEPSGNLDHQTGLQVMDLLFSLAQRHGSTVILVTHSPELARRCQRRLALQNGILSPAPGNQ